jgi:hypothetical protein
MASRFEQWTRNTEALIIAGVVVIVAIAYVVSRLTSG